MEQFWEAAKEIVGGLYINMDLTMHSSGKEKVKLFVIYADEQIWQSKQYDGDNKFQMCLMELKLWVFNSKSESEEVAV